MMTSADVSRELLVAVRDRLRGLGEPGIPVSQDVLLLGLAEMIGDLLSMAPVEAQKILMPDILRKVTEKCQGAGQLHIAKGRA